jgi:hypothetical protein
LQQSRAFNSRLSNAFPDRRKIAMIELLRSVFISVSLFALLSGGPASEGVLADEKAAGDNLSQTAVEGLAAEKSAAVEQPAATNVSQARRQAEILHSTLHSSLRVIHDRYYREDEALPIPAAILGEVFNDVEAEQHVKLRWLAVEGLAMNSDHKPADEFERQAAEQLKAGKRSHEIAADGLYRRAAPITLSGHCLKCHMPDRRSTRDRVAGLIIAIPVTPESGP